MTALRENKVIIYFSVVENYLVIESKNKTAVSA